MPESPYRALRIFLRVFSLLAVAGSLLMIFAEKPLIVRIFLRPPEGEVSTLLLSLFKEMGGMVLMLGVLLWLASRNPVRNVAIVDGLIVGLCMLAVTPLLSLWMTDIRSIYPAYFLWGDLRCGSQLQLCFIGYGLGMCTGNLSEISEETLAAGEDVVRRDTVALWPDLRQRKR
jgi:hypothetical protein